LSIKSVLFKQLERMTSNRKKRPNNFIRTYIY
jgi:hypothetical protein